MTRLFSLIVMAALLAFASLRPLYAADSSDSRDTLFELDDENAIAETSQAPSPETSAVPAANPASNTVIRWGGFVQGEAARTFALPSHWSKLLTRAQLVGQGQLAAGIKWKLGVRADYDAVFEATDHYSVAVRDDREFNVQVRETYLDFNAAGLDFRLGRQHIVWGEMVGLFFADVVSARDTREFILPEFEIQRIPQWAIRAEHFHGDWHSEALWIPYATLNETGAFGDDFHPSLIPAPGLGLVVRGEQKPTRNLSHSNFGVRTGVLYDGWDVTGFVYSSVDATPHFTRTIEFLPAATVVYTPRHNRIWQAGSTMAKDFGDFVVKSEAVYTHGRNFSVTDFNDADGVVKQNHIDYAVGVDLAMREHDLKFNLQGFQRVMLSHVATLVTDRYETGVSALITTTLGDFTPSLLVIQGLNQDDRLLRPSVDWTVARNMRLRGGLDLFSGRATGLFGQYNNRDRAYVELKYNL